MNFEDTRHKRFLYRSLGAQIFKKKVPHLKKKSEKNNSWADVGPRSAWEKLSQNVSFEAARFRVLDRHPSIDKTNDCAMKSERGALVRGSDPPSGHSGHKTAGDTWRAPTRRLTQALLCGKQATKSLDPSPMAKNRPFFQIWKKSIGRRGQLLAP